MTRRKLLAVAMMAMAASDAMAQDGPVPPLQAHRAIYDLELKQASERSGIDAIYGRMVYEFTGAACRGYTTRFRFATRINTGDDVRTSDQRLTSFEDAKSGVFRFDNQSFTDETLDKQLKGEARIRPGGVTVTLEGENARRVDLPESVFPTMHMQEVIAKALDGKTLFDARVFDGSEDGDASLLVTTIIGKPKTDADSGAESDGKAAAALSAKPWWPVTASYFNEGAGGDSEPAYRLSFKLYDNGVSRDLVMDYGEFALAGKLSKLELLPEETCEPAKAP